MGIIQSILCSTTICIERVLTWTFCASMFFLVMCMMVVLMVYGISVGYHYAQKELVSFAESSVRLSTTPGPKALRRADAAAAAPQPVVRLLAVNRTREPGAQPLVAVYQTKKPKEQIFVEPTVSPIILLEAERSPEQDEEEELSPNEKKIVKNLIGRFRRSKNLRLLSLKNETKLFRFPIPSI